MPRTYRRKKYAGRRRHPARRTRGSIYGAAAKQLYRDVSKLKNLINVEFKYFDTPYQSSLGDPGAILCQNLVPLGDSSTSRDGQQIRIKSLECECLVNMSNNVPAACRIIYFLDLEARGLVPPIS